jgi:hypothetical protein
MSSVNEINPKVDNSVRVFDTFNDFGINVPANEYDAVYSYLRSVFTDNTAAENFTTALFRVAAESDTPVLTILKQIQAPDSIRVSINIAYYLNGLRSPSTLLGINTAVTPNAWAARNVVA